LKMSSWKFSRGIQKQKEIIERRNSVSDLVNFSIRTALLAVGYDGSARGAVRSPPRLRAMRRPAAIHRGD
jgi:hypothetical protein